MQWCFGGSAHQNSGHIMSKHPDKLAVNTSHCKSLQAQRVSYSEILPITIRTGDVEAQFEVLLSTPKRTEETNLTAF